MTVYGHPESLPISETEATIPISYYGITKYAAERYIMASGSRNDLAFDFHTTAFRMFNVYGERQRLDNPYQGVLGFFVGSALRHDPITIHGSGDQTRDFIYIADVVEAWFAALDNPLAFGEVFNLGFGEGISINRLVSEVLGACNHKRDNYPIEWGPRRPGDQEYMTADIQKARDLLRWEPEVSLQTGLHRNIHWARNQQKEILSE